MAKEVFKVTDWNGKPRYFTDTELFEKVQSDSRRSNYNWVASAPELNTCINRWTFNPFIADKIRFLILECFSELLLKHRIEEADLKAAISCYNKLQPSFYERERKAAKVHFVYGLIKNVTAYDATTSSFADCEALDAWVNSQCGKYAHVKFIDEALLKSLHQDFKREFKREFR